MSHFKERKEKNCLNCGAQVEGRFCQVCGQENSEPKESFWHLVTHFFNDITHYDGKFLNTVRYLLTRPGFLTAQYTRGRRVSYLHPIRMYVFTSAFFFLIFFSFISKHNDKKEGLEGMKEELMLKEDELKKFRDMEAQTGDPVMLKAIRVNIERHQKDTAALAASIRKEENEDDGSDWFGAKQKADSASNNNTQVKVPSFKDVFDSVRIAIDSVSEMQKRDSGRAKKLAAVNDVDFLNFEFYKDEATYKAVQKELPPNRQDGLVESALKLRLLHWHDQQKKGGEQAFNALLDRFKHSFPTILFISLPIFAFLLKLLYIRRGQFYYADHGIFAIHVYCALFILMLLYYGLDGLDIKWAWWGWDILKFAVSAYMVYYVYKSMRVYYAQGRWKTILKFIFLAWMTLIIMTVLILIFFIISAAKS